MFIRFFSRFTLLARGVPIPVRKDLFYFPFFHAADVVVDVEIVADEVFPVEFHRKILGSAAQKQAFARDGGGKAQQVVG